ncbi:MAG: DUF366 family protein [Planctomycetota bacterium]
MEGHGKRAVALIRPSVHFESEPVDYDGRQLRSHWLYETFGLAGDAAAAFVGRADVAGEHLVDLADRQAGLVIRADRMLHLIVEVFDPRLDRAVSLQRHLVHAARELVEERSGARLRRSGDDLFHGEGKLSVSIATVSAVSNLVHLGINVTNAGTPVRTASLEDLGLDAAATARDLLARFADDLESMGKAAVKVRPVP